MRSRPGDSKPFGGIGVWNLAYRIARRYYGVDPRLASEIADLAGAEFFDRIRSLCEANLGTRGPTTRDRPD